jgi:hypothetical protein
LEENKKMIKNIKKDDYQSVLKAARNHKLIVVTGCKFRDVKTFASDLLKLTETVGLLYTKEIHISIGPCRVKFLPLGNGDKIRGLRPEAVFVLEAENCCSKILGKVASGILAVSSSPADNYNHLSFKEKKQLASTIDAALRTTNGDTGPIEITARQAAILLVNYLHKAGEIETGLDDIYERIENWRKENQND